MLFRSVSQSRYDPDQYELKIVSRMLDKDKWEETEKKMYLSKEQLDMIFSFFSGVHNELNK